MRKGLFAILLAMVMVLSATVGAAAAEPETAESGLSLAVTQGKGSVTVRVYAQGCAGVSNGRITVSFDGSVLKLSAAEVADVCALSSVNGENAGQVSLAWVGSELTAEKTLLLTLTLEAVQEITQDMTYTAVSDGMYAGTEVVEVAAASIVGAYVPPVDTAALEQAIADAEALDAALYTQKSMEAVRAALMQALAVLADADATAEDVDAAAQKLTAAMKELVKLEDAESPPTADDSGIEWQILLMLAALAGISALVVYAIRAGKSKGIAMVLALVMLLNMIPVAGIAAMIDGEDATGKKFEASSGRTNVIIDGETGKTVGTVQEILDTTDLKIHQSVSDLQIAPYDDEDMVRVIVELDGASLLAQGYTQNQISQYSGKVASDAQKLRKLQDAVCAYIGQIAEAAGQTAAVKYNYTVALNGIAMTVPYGMLDEIRGVEGVKGAYVVSQYLAPETQSGNNEIMMYATTESFGATQTWTELGYTGAGMVVSIIDTGLDIDHPSFADAPAGPRLSLQDIEAALTDLNAYRLYGKTSAVKLEADDLYHSEKVPFGFNYVDAGLDITHDFDSQGDHGTHVAGIAAANKLESTEVVGVAPDAQVVIMKVFGQNGGAFFDDILAAIEDSIRLGADVINMSLGAQAGFSEDSALVNQVYGRILESDMILAVAAGNANSAATGNALGTNLNYTSDPDNGLVNSPATYLASTAVASLENGSMMLPYFMVGDTKIPYVDYTDWDFAQIAGEYTYVAVPGIGDEPDYEGLDVEGKIALVQRGTIDFESKQRIAYDHGAAALVVYDNVDADLISMYNGGYLPNVFISKANGEAMLAAAVDGVGTMTIMPYGKRMAVPSNVAGLLSDFSCWGVTPDLQLTPDVTAPGGNIYSCYTDGVYGTMSGTSMASPHIAGMSALLLQYLQQNYPEMSEAQMHTVAESLIMCTAVPVQDADGILYSPRKQGAGAANAYSAISSPVYLTSLQKATGELTPKISMGDDPERTGVFTFSFEMHNLTGTDQVYLLEGILLTDQYVEIDGVEYMGEIGRNLTGEVTFEALGIAALPEYDADQSGATDMQDVQFVLDAVNGLKTLSDALADLLDLHADGVVNTVDAQLLYERVMASYEAQRTITVAANSSVSVQVTVTLSEEDKAYMQAHYENGIYVDGFVRAYAQTEGGVDLSLPLVGFYGDWHDAPMFDTGWYYEDEETVEYNRYLNVIFATLGEGTNYAGLGINPYIEEIYDAEHNVLSPNGDGFYDYVPEIYISLMRSAELLDYTWTDANGKELFYEWSSYARKSYYWSGYDACMPAIYTDAGCLPFTFLDENGELTVSDLEHLTLTIRGYLDDGDLDDIDTTEEGAPIPDPADADAMVQIPVVIDLKAPKMDISSITYFEEDGRYYVSFRVEDNYDIAAVVAMTMGGDAYEYIPVTTKQTGVDGEQDTVIVDITDFDATFQIVLCDYGCNESYYVLTNEYNTGLTEGKFYAYRRYSTFENSGAIYTTDQFNGWYSFDSADDMRMHTSQPYSGEATVYAAEYVDGYIFGAQAGPNGYNTLFVSKAGSWDRIALGSDYAMRKIVYEWVGVSGTYYPMELIALDMTYDYTTGTMYMLANALENNYFPDGETNILLRIDITTGDVTILGKILPADGENFTALTLACDTDGTLYTVSYENGMLYTIDKEPVSTTANYGYGTYIATCIDADGVSNYYPAAYAQSMTFDKATGELYWAAYQGKTGTAYFIELDKTTGEILGMTMTEDNAEMVGLLMVYDSGEDIIQEAPLTGITLNSGSLHLNVGQTQTLTVSPSPYNAELAEVTWRSLDEGVATVSVNGIVEAIGIGSTTIVASCGGFEMECTVSVSQVSGTLFAYSDGYWLLMDAGTPDEAAQVADAMELEGDTQAAVYYKGHLYAAAVNAQYDEAGNETVTTNLYKLNASTLQGQLVGTYEGDTTALAFNYADGYMYGLVKHDTWEETADGGYGQVVSYDLVRVNPKAAKIEVVTNLDALFTYSDAALQWNTCSGALAIDYEGNFYVNGDNWDEYCDNILVRFRLNENDEISDAVTYAGFSDYGYYGDAMVWSERNGGILHVAGDALEWVDVSDMTNVITVSLGKVRGAGSDVYALTIPLNTEPETPYVAPVVMTLEQRYTVPAGETATVIPNMEPWNATGECSFQIADTAIATVDENGVITGITEGQTTLTVTCGELVATAEVVVEKNPGYLYGFFQANLTQMLPLEAWGKLPIYNAEGYDFITDSYDLTIYAAAYFDGFLYAMGQHSTDGGYYMLKISPANFAYEILCESEILVRGMAFDYTTGTMYAVGSTEKIHGGLYQMDLETGALTFVSDNDTGATLVAMACDQNGTLYVADDYGEIYTMDKENAEIWSTGIYGGTSAYLQSMTYDYNNDSIYWIVGGTVYQVDTQAKILTVLGQTECAVSGLFSVPEEEPAVPETVAPSGVAMAQKDTVAVGETLQLNAVVLPISVAAVDQTLIWHSDDESIATVDANGIITGVGAGATYIHATDAEGHTASILITVTAEHRYFYGYDELSHAWVQFGMDGVIVNTWKDAEGLSPIVAAQYIGDVLYAYDEDGYFYSVDTQTFQRTLLGAGISGESASLTAWDESHNEKEYYVNGVPYRMIDLTYSMEEGRRGTVTTLYGVMMAWNISTWRDAFSYKIVKLDMTDGTITEIIVEDALCDDMSLRPTNLLYREGYLYTVNGYITGMITRIDTVDGSLTGTAIFPEYWGDFNGGRSLIEDPLTGVTYAIRDMRTEYIGTAGYTGAYATSELCVIGLGLARCESIATIGTNMRIVGLYIK